MSHKSKISPVGNDTKFQFLVISQADSECSATLRSVRYLFFKSGCSSNLEGEGALDENRSEQASERTRLRAGRQEGVLVEELTSTNHSRSALSSRKVNVNCQRLGKKVEYQFPPAARRHDD